MTLSTNELTILKALHAAGAANVTIPAMLDYLPESMSADRGGISSRLCRMRGKNLVLSETVGNSNLWTINDEGMAAIAADMERIATTPISVPIQPDSPDILPDKRPDSIAADFAAAIEAAEEIAAAELSATDPNPPGCADATPEVAPDLIDEANNLRLRRPLPREHDALYVLSALIDTLGRDQPGMAYELTRIAAYIEGEYA